MKKDLTLDFTKPAKNKRPSWDEYFLQLSDLVSTRATCQRLKVGAVLVKDKKIISTGYCGAPKKLPDCFEAGCYMVDGHCIRTIHAEVNAVVQAAFHGISTKGTTIYVNWLPCYQCAKVLVNAGIEQIVFRRVYRPDPVTKKLLRKAKIKLIQSDENELLRSKLRSIPSGKFFSKHSSSQQAVRYSASKIKSQSKIILGFVGKLCAGKGAAISYLVEKHGFYASSCSDRIRESLRAEGLEVTREKLLDFGGKLREKFGPEALAKMTWEKISEEGVKKGVVDSIRSKGEAEFLKSLPNFYLIAIDSDQKTRFERMKARNRGESDPTTFEEFKRIEEADINSGGRDVEAVIQMADYHLKNNGTEKDLHKKLDNLLASLRL